MPRATPRSPRAVPLVVSTGVHTGRSPKDKFIVREPGSEDRIWWGAINQPIDPANHASLGARLREHLAARTTST